MFKKLLKILPKTPSACILRHSSKNSVKEPKVKQKTAKNIEELLKVRPYHALEIATQNKKLCSMDMSEIKSNYETCMKEDISHDDIVRNPNILSESNLSKKINLLRGLPYPSESTLPLLGLITPQIVFLINDEIVNKRLSKISKLLECDIYTTCCLMAEKIFLVRLDLEQMEETIKLLKKFKVTIKDIRNDLWVLKYKPNTIREKLDSAVDEVEEIKTWMVRVKPEIFDIYVKRRSDNKSVLGDSSLAGYLSQKLKCTEDEAMGLIIKQPALKNKSLKKMEEIINFLYNYGFKPSHIYKVPKILLHSVETTRKRLLQLEDHGMHMDSLYILTKSQKQYMQYYELLLKASKKNKSKA